MLELEKRLATGPPSEQTLKEVNERVVGIQQEGYKVVNLGRNFIQEAIEDRDKYLDKEDAINCVESLLAQFEVRRASMTDGLGALHQKLNLEKQKQLQWKALAASAQKVLKIRNAILKKRFQVMTSFVTFRSSLSSTKRSTRNSIP